MTNFKKNIGFLWPCDGLNEQEYWKFLPKDVRWLTARYGAETETEELTERNLEQYASIKILKKAAVYFALYRYMVWLAETTPASLFWEKT